MKQAETTVSEAGIAAGAVPSPLEMPAIFMLGHIVTGDVILREIEETLRTHYGRCCRPGAIIHMQSAPKTNECPPIQYSGRKPWPLCSTWAEAKGCSDVPARRMKCCMTLASGLSNHCPNVKSRATKAQQTEYPPRGGQSWRDTTTTAGAELPRSTGH